MDRSDAIHNRWQWRSGTAARAAPAPPITARAMSWAGRGASAGTASRVSFSTTPVVARAPRTPSPIATPCSLLVRGINDGPKASRAATVSRGAAGDAATGFSHRASSCSWPDPRAWPRTARSRRMPSAGCSLIATVSSSGGRVELEPAAGVAPEGGGQAVAGGEAQRERRLAGQLLAAGLGCGQALGDAAPREGVGAGHHDPGGVALGPQVASCVPPFGGQLDRSGEVARGGELRDQDTAAVYGHGEP